MKNSPAVYLGRIVDKKKFRTFVYGLNDVQKLVESWDEFQDAMASGLWFAKPEEARVEPILLKKPKASKAKYKEKSTDETASIDQLTSASKN